MLFFFVLVEILLVRRLTFLFVFFVLCFLFFWCVKQDDRDWRVSGGNPCLEQSLESFEMCCLVETFPARHESKEDYLDTLKYAFLYAKTVTLGSTHWSKTNQVMLRNRRIGCSMSGVAQFTAQHGLPGLLEWCEEGYDQVQKIDATLSEWLAIPESIKTTSVKPSGTVSLLAGSTPGNTRTHCWCCCWWCG